MSNITMGYLYNQLAEIMQEEAEYILESDYPEDRVNEIVDSLVPIYYDELAEMLAQDTGLAEVSDYGLLPENPTVWQIISMAIYELLQERAYEILENMRDGN